MKRAIKKVLTLIYVTLCLVIIYFSASKKIAFSVVSGRSMEPTLYNSEVYFTTKFSKSFKRGDIVVIKEPDKLIVKRIIGVPNDMVEIKDGQTFLNGKPLYEPYLKGQKTYRTGFYDKTKLKNKEYFVMGDNRSHSSDSREKGAFKENDILGVIRFKIWPFPK